ncbi:Translocator protein [Clonorchis sinensis]|uniref:Benzodiazepine receptor n=2 Tax=Clonorchis sinensis TaxID=79923 RepID=G7YQD4_CLOSI|nr:Translocator protein [Clonorchis sinensis]GAA55164.1 benzodiazepine receptor [Clonorchis sinensis]
MPGEPHHTRFQVCRATQIGSVTQLGEGDLANMHFKYQLPQSIYVLSSKGTSDQYTVSEAWRYVLGPNSELLMKDIIAFTMQSLAASNAQSSIAALASLVQYLIPSMDYRIVPFIITPYIGSIPGRYIVRRNLAWSKTLKRVWFAPPNWVFAPVWNCLYIAMGTASYLVWRDSTSDTVRLPLSIYGLHLLLNWSWIPVFFGAHKLKLSVVVMLSTLSCVSACAVLFRPINVLASNLMLPYTIWLAYATMVNIGTAILN